MIDYLASLDRWAEILLKLEKFRAIDVASGNDMGIEMHDVGINQAYARLRSLYSADDVATIEMMLQDKVQAVKDSGNWGSPISIVRNRHCA